MPAAEATTRAPPRPSRTALGSLSVTFSDEILVTRSFAGRHGQHVHADAELTVLGAASISQGMPIGASGSRPAVKDPDGRADPALRSVGRRLDRSGLVVPAGRSCPWSSRGWLWSMSTQDAPEAQHGHDADENDERQRATRFQHPPVVSRRL